MWGPSWFVAWLAFGGVSVTKIQDTGECYNTMTDNVTYCLMDKQICYIENLNSLNVSEIKKIRCFKTINK